MGYLSIHLPWHAVPVTEPGTYPAHLHLHAYLTPPFFPRQWFGGNRNNPVIFPRSCYKTENRFVFRRGSTRAACQIYIIYNMYRDICAAADPTRRKTGLSRAIFRQSAKWLPAVYPAEGARRGSPRRFRRAAPSTGASTLSVGEKAAKRLAAQAQAAFFAPVREGISYPRDGRKFQKGE